MKDEEQQQSVYELLQLMSSFNETRRAILLALAHILLQWQIIGLNGLPLIPIALVELVEMVADSVAKNGRGQ